MVRFNDHLSYSYKNNEMETQQTGSHTDKGVWNANKYSISYFIFSEVKYLLFVLQNFYNWRAFLLQCCFLFCLSINPSNVNSENLPNVNIHKLFTHKVGLGSFRETAWMNNFTTRRDNEQQSLNRVKIKLGEEEQGRRTGSGKWKVLPAVF